MAGDLPRLLSASLNIVGFPLLWAVFLCKEDSVGNGGDFVAESPRLGEVQHLTTHRQQVIRFRASKTVNRLRAHVCERLECKVRMQGQHYNQNR